MSLAICIADIAKVVLLMRFDLHLHTTASDGHLSPAELVIAALSAGLDAIAVTDHDTVAAVAPALDSATGSQLLVIPGVELSATYDSRDVHILGYFVDCEDSTFLARLEVLRAARLTRAIAMVDSLAAAGMDMSIDEVLELTDGGSVGRSHVARALVERGHAKSVAEAFELLIGRGRPFYVPKPGTSALDVLSVVRAAGGISVLAHPGVTKVDDLIPALIDAGLGGIEAFHGEHSSADRERYSKIAHEAGLLCTGGSDFHTSSSPGPGLGQVEMPDSVLRDLLLTAGSRTSRS
ncbi:MAG: PHP domain-containing protein [Actinomycetota bacterium]|nr:PHP domain-containing protein [Actinomycetota bacterium]